ncbi:MAG: hypothetical protein ABWY93_02930 [Mycobacterium sp.]
MTDDATHDEPVTGKRTRGEQIRDLIMLLILAIWITYAVAAVVQLFRDGSKVLETLPPFWFWGIPLAPFSALYAPWGAAIKTISAQPTPPETPAAPADPSGGPP